MDLYNIKCPHCQALQTDLFELTDVVTYWGFGDHGNTVELVCQHCEKSMTLKEHVTRSYEVDVV